MKTSIIVVNYNYARYLRDAILSALDQPGEDVEVVVVDDGSSDESVDLIRSFGDRVIPVLKDNGGQGSAFNAGFRRSQGDVVIFLDADDIIDAGAVSMILPRFDSPDVIKCHWPMRRVDAGGKPLGTHVPGEALAEGFFRNLVVEHGPEDFATYPSTPPSSGNAWSRRFLRKVLPMNEEVFRWGADQYLLNLSLIHGRVTAVHQPMGCYRVHGTNDTLKPLRQRLEDFFIRHEHCRTVIARDLHAMGLDVDADTWPRDTWFHRISAALDDIENHVAPGAAFILADDASWGSEPAISGRRRISFPEFNGHFSGPPADDRTAIKELERLRRAGAEFIVFVSTNYWYLCQYPALMSYLRARFTVAYSGESSVIYDLRVARNLSQP